jgi:hypothetical protein
LTENIDKLREVFKAGRQRQPFITGSMKGFPALSPLPRWGRGLG